MQPQLSYSPGLASENNPHFLLYLFGLFALFILVRLLLGDHTLNGFVPYTTDGGSLVGKIHPGSYGLFLLFAIAAFSTRFELDGWEVRLVRALLAFLFAILVLGILMIATGNATSAGYLVDTYMLACLAAPLMFLFPTNWQRGIGTMIILVILLSALIALFEAVTHVRLLPYPYREASFRPTGLFGHPLEVGIRNVLAIGIIAGMRWRPSLKILCITLLLVSTAAAGARIATMTAFLVMFLLAICWKPPHMSPAQRGQIKALAMIGVFLALPAIAVALLSTGFLDRLSQGLVDQSSMARIDIYRIFGFVTWKQILWGTDIAPIQEIALQRLQIEHIESSLLVFIFNFGLFGAAVFLFFLARVLLVLVKGAPANIVIAIGATLLIALTNNSLSVKSSLILTMLVMVIAARAEQRGRQGQAG